uniref:Uncharacterized protein n=1 Tax=Rhizophora mucronata TaxID=61149 RepID=A0A2P2Q3S4_RHIMU
MIVSFIVRQVRAGNRKNGIALKVLFHRW